MTCVEFRVLLPENPKDLTRATRGAFMVHYLACMPCRLECKAHARRQRYTPAEVAATHLLVQEDLRDPEFRRMTAREGAADE